MIPQKSRNSTSSPKQSRIPVRSQRMPTEVDRVLSTSLRAEAVREHQGQSSLVPSTASNRTVGTRVVNASQSQYGQQVSSTDIFSNGSGNKFYGGHLRQEGGEISRGREPGSVQISGFNGTGDSEFRNGFSLDVIGGQTIEDPSLDQMASSRNVAQMRHFAHTQNSVFDNTNMQFIAGNRFNHRNSPPSYAPGYNAHTSSGSQLRQPPQLSPGRPSLPNNHYTLPVDRHSTASTLPQGARPQKKFYVFIGPADWTTNSRTNLQKLRQIMQHFDDRSPVPKDPDTIEYIDQERRLLRLAFSSEEDADEFTTYFGEHVRQLPREYKKMRAHIQL